jgi:hypothetical protein
MAITGQYVSCLECTHEPTIKTALDLAFKSWPNQSWIAFRCPICEEVNHLHIGNGFVAEGYLDGFPSPSFIQRKIIPIDDFRVGPKSNMLRIASLNLKWEVPSHP